MKKQLGRVVEMVSNRNLKFLMAFMLVFALFAGGFGQKAAAASSTVTVKVLGEQDEVLTEKQVALADNKTAFDALVKSVGEENVKIEEFDFGKMIKEIQGLAGTDKIYWAFYANGVSAMTGADSYKAQPGDTYLFRYQSEAPKDKVNLKIVGKAGKSQDYKDVYYLGEPNAFQLLQTVVGPENLKFDQYDFGKMVTSINGLASTENTYWSFYVNDEPQMIGAEDYTLEPGKTVSFVYETFTPPAEEPETEQPGLEAEKYPKDSFQKNLHEVLENIQTSGQLGEWEAIALKQAGKPIPASYLEEVAKRVTERNGQFRSITDYERYTLGILAAGGNPENFAGYNLVEPIYNGDVLKQGLNGVAYALIALDSANFKVPANAKWTREKLVDYLLENQNSNGGWGLNQGAGSDPDTTAMVLTALAPYKEDGAPKPAIEKGIEYLKNLFASSAVDSSTATAQAVIAMSALGLDANSNIIAADGKTLLGFLASFIQPGGGFAWKAGQEADALSTQQGVQALVAYHLYKNGKGSLYSLNLADVPVDPVIKPAPSGQPVQPAAPDKQASTEKEGHRLPDTATDSYTWLALGFILATGGGTVYLLRRKQQA
ncbi:DUF4430 domain-containing protein [Neobacillus notoginsengisoli]|uniref:DUF4430 domain-containing protein n=1 Tax=Neobacillus notoginsengisoli TaxID=1578198 RepID=A0A417YYH5_9BACI|nr:DUF4430 domain-containing protein [Neobacillus notoginsengisoli]RHW42577.1 DUF4430 domain-containing protein [Neobacillus notoginsengisoli]